MTVPELCRRIEALERVFCIPSPPMPEHLPVTRATMDALGKRVAEIERRAGLGSTTHSPWTQH
jgi:hypothetical protein